MGAGLAFLRDDFADNVIAAAWGVYPFLAGSATCAETGGQAVITLPSSTAGAHDNGYYSTSSYDLTGDVFVWNIATMVSTAVAAYASVGLLTDGSNQLRWFQQSGTLKAQKIVAGVGTDLFSVAWSATTYKYLRMRESGGSVFFDSSTDSISWTARTNTPNPFVITDLHVLFAAGCGNVVSPGTFKLDDVNLIRPALTTNWRWQQIVWPLTERIRNTTTAIDTAGTVQGYVVTADTVDASDNPSGNVRYWSGPMDAGRTLTEQTTQAAAQAMAVNFPLDARLDLPTTVEARCIRVYDRSIDAAAFMLRELFPRRLIEGDDIRAETITALHIAASSITADRLDVQQLSAITADCGTLTAGIIDGVTIYAGSGNEIVLDNSGIEITGSTSYFALRAYGFTDGTSRTSDLWALEGASSHGVNLQVYPITGKNGTIDLTVDAPTGKVSSISLNTRVNSVTSAQLTVAAVGFNFNNADVFINSHGLNVNTTGAGSGEIRASDRLRLNGVTSQSFQMKAHSIVNNGIAQVSIGAADSAVIFVLDSSGTQAIFMLNGGNHTTNEVSDPNSTYSVTAGTASSTNIYWSAGNSRYEIENKRGVTATYSVFVFLFN